MHTAAEPPATLDSVILHSNSAGRKKNCSSCPYSPFCWSTPSHSERDRLGGPTLSPCTSLPDLPLTDYYPEGLRPLLPSLVRQDKEEELHITVLPRAFPLVLCSLHSSASNAAGKDMLEESPT